MPQSCRTASSDTVNISFNQRIGPVGKLGISRFDVASDQGWLKDGNVSVVLYEMAKYTH
jgi:hypothetical protein